MSKNANIAGLLISAAVFAGSCAQIISKAGTKDIELTTISVPDDGRTAAEEDIRIPESKCKPISAKKDAVKLPSVCGSRK